MATVFVVVVVALNTINNQYSPKKRKKKYQGLETSHISSPILSFPLPFLQPIGDELGEIAVTDKQILLILAMNGLLSNRFILIILFFYFFYLLSLLFRTWTCCRSGRRSGQSHIIIISAR